ncbi:MAG: hypothetical protein KA716_27420 [Gloeotrichia echinulata DEX184]|nr:hypothetical protein [Gloeotrichia echinulata DEX184]
MSFIKKLGKQLSFVVLIGSAIFSASSSSASASISVTIWSNTDVLFDPAYVRTLFASNPTQVDLILLGGVHFAPGSTEFDIDTTLGTEIYNPFRNFYGNLKDVGGTLEEQISTPTGGVGGVSGILIRGVYRVRNSVGDPPLAATLPPPLTLGLTSTAPNPPSLSLGGSTGDGVVCPYSSCVVLHYGYTINISSFASLNPYFLQSTYTLRASGNTVQNLTQTTPIATPQIDVDPPLGAKQLKVPTEYLVVYSQQTNPLRPGVTVLNFTQFPVPKGQIPRLSFINSPVNPAVKLSNVYALRTNQKIPLDQLTSKGLPLKTPGFKSIPSANGILERGKNTRPVVLEIPVVDVCEVVSISCR